MKITLSANHLKRYKEIGLLLWKYGRSDLVQQMGIDESIDAAEVKAAPCCFLLRRQRAAFGSSAAFSRRTAEARKESRIKTHGIRNDLVRNSGNALRAIHSRCAYVD